MRRPRPKFKVSFYLYFCCFWMNVTQINFENIKRKKRKKIISDSCFQLKLWFNVDARAPSIPLLNFPFKDKINTFQKSNWGFSALNEYTTLVDGPWTPCLTESNISCLPSTTKRKSVNHNSNLIKEVLLLQYWEKGFNTVHVSQFTEALTLL